LVLGNVVGGLIVNIVCIFVSDNVGLLIGCAVGDDIVANKLIGNIDGVRVGVSASVVVGNCVGEIIGLSEGDVVGIQVGIIEEFVLSKFVEYMKSFFWENLLKQELGC
jgi:hypothetical protein